MGCTANVVTGSVDNMDHVHAAISLCPGRLAGVIHLAMALKV
jgi:hypothetical protein